MSRPHGRHELKHYINYADVIELRSSPPFVAGHDKNSIEGNGYRIKSLYFDNYNDKALKEKINGVNKREKFRLALSDRFSLALCFLFLLTRKAAIHHISWCLMLKAISGK